MKMEGQPLIYNNNPYGCWLSETLLDTNATRMVNIYKNISSLVSIFTQVVLFQYVN